MRKDIKKEKTNWWLSEAEVREDVVELLNKDVNGQCYFQGKELDIFVNSRYVSEYFSNEYMCDVLEIENDSYGKLLLAV